jgi:uncharacterized membrane protein YoaK (UPF0700 family)
MQGKMALLLAAFLTWMAGFVDAVGYLSLGQIYTANMSGNSVAVGIHAVLGEWTETLRRLLPVVAYFAGLLYCRLLIAYGASRHIRRIASLTLLCEIALLVPVCLASRAVAPVLSWTFVGLLAGAMGVQNATLTHFSNLTVHTGFVTGTLVKCAENMASYLKWALDQIWQKKRPIVEVLARSDERKALSKSVWLALIWLAYVIGACFGAFGQHLYKFRSLLVPIIGLVFVGAVDLHQPLALPEEREQQNLQS